MSTQDTTLPPLPEPIAGLVKDIHNAIGELAGCTRYPDLTEAIDELAAIAAQAPQPTCVWSVESKTFRALYATKADAEKFVASLPITVSGGVSVSEVPVIGAQQAQGVPTDHLPTKEHIRELAQEAADQVMEQAQVFASAWALVGGRFDSGNALEDAEEAKSELRTLVRSLADLAAETVRPAAAPQAEPQPEREPERKPLTDAQIEKLREQTFSTSNPFCPCDSKTMRKAVWAAERAHGIGTKGGDKR